MFHSVRDGSYDRVGFSAREIITLLMASSLKALSPKRQVGR